MLFNSFEFLLIFLPVTMAVFFVMARRSHALAAAWLAGASVAFYGYWNPRFVLLLFISIVFNYGMGYFLGRSGEGSRHGRTLLMFSAAANTLEEYSERLSASSTFFARPMARKIVPIAMHSGFGR